MDYDKLLLDELRLVPYEEGDAGMSDARLAKAVTLNENLMSLGYVLSPPDLAAIAVSPSLDGFYQKVRDMTDTVDAEPMYPGFPKQVMKMDAVRFRLDQMAHYFSTYGLEDLFGVKVRKGWLPHLRERMTAPATQKRILDATTIKLLPAGERYLTPLTLILSRRERMTLPEREIVGTAIAHVTPEEAAGIRVGFKENLNTLYDVIFHMEDRDAAFRMMRGLCQHTGDVLRCVEVLLRKNGFHLRTSQKRFLVRLLESYPVKDFRANLALSGKGAERNIVLLNYLDYSVYSRSGGHMDAVNALRDGTLRTWGSIARSMITNGDEGTLDFIAQRPGMMLRMVAWLMRLGYDPEEIQEKLSANATSLSMQTLVTNLNFFGKQKPEERPDAPRLYEIFEALLRRRMQSCSTALRGKKILLRMDGFDLEMSEIHASDKSAEGGYIRSGLAYRIPENVDRLRFFVYWNDPLRVDVDLHTGYTDLEGERHAVGWNRDFRNIGVVFSGDITHSDAAEYIDIDLNAPIDKVYADIHLYNRARPNFGAVETCFVGMMAVPKEEVNGQDVALYSEANCFFRHNLRQKCTLIDYGYIDVQRRSLVFDGQPGAVDTDWYGGLDHRRGRMSLARYLELLAEAQDAAFCLTEDEADVILVMGKAENEKEVSLIDANFFMD